MAMKTVDYLLMAFVIAVLIFAGFTIVKNMSSEPDKIVSRVSASHILVETEQEANDIIAELEAGANFAELAKEKSTGPSGPRGGALGWFGKGQMVKPFEDAAFSGEKGEVVGPVQTQFGWHVIMIDDLEYVE